MILEKVDEESPFEGIDVGEYSTPAFVDLDSDGLLDLVVGDGVGKLHYYINVGMTPTFLAGKTRTGQ